MISVKQILLSFSLIAMLYGCNSDSKFLNSVGDNVEAESFADLQVLRYDIPGFENLTAEEKELAYYLYEAALCGRDIIYDQKSKYGLTVRKTIENIFGTFKGDRKTKNWKFFEDYCGQFWFSNGYYHHYGQEKFVPECNFEYFLSIAKESDPNGFPLDPNVTLDSFLASMKKIMFDKNFEPKCVNLASDVDNITNSFNNFYENVTANEVENFYNKFNSTGDAPSWGLNSKTTKDSSGNIIEKIWKSGGMYGAAIDKIIYWLEKAVPVAENNQQKVTFEKLIKFLKSGDLKDFDDYSISWVNDKNSKIDVVNGFIEVYLDAIGKKGSYQSVVSIRDEDATKRIKTIADNAQWFEDNSPLFPEHKKDTVKGITAKAINVIVESGDCAPSTPIGVNLPNADWIRKSHGSKSVSLSNIIHAYNVFGSKGGFLQEFVENKDEIQRAKEYGSLASDLHTDMHECIGHASGKINPGVATTDITLKNYASTLEEARADLVGLYYIMDQKLVDIGVMPNLDVAKAEYESYMRNGLMLQLTRLKLGDNIEEAHMRNRQLNAMWVFEKGKNDKVVEFYSQNNKTYIRINDYLKLRNLFGQLLKEIQRIKSEGDYIAGKNLVENYGVKVNQVIHKEVLDRYAKLNLKPYKGFIQPKLEAEMDGDKIKGIKVVYYRSFFDQMMDYGKNYAYLPIHN